MSANIVSSILTAAAVPHLVTASNSRMLVEATQMAVHSLSAQGPDITDDQAVLDLILGPVFGRIDPDNTFDLGGIASNMREAPQLKQLVSSLAELHQKARRSIPYVKLWYIADEHQSSIETYQRSGDLVGTGLSKHVIPSGDHTEGDSYGTSLMFEKMCQRARANGIELTGDLPPNYEQTVRWSGKPLANGPHEEEHHNKTVASLLTEHSQLVTDIIKYYIVGIIYSGSARGFSDNELTCSFLCTDYVRGQQSNDINIGKITVLCEESDNFALVSVDDAHKWAGQRNLLDYGQYDSFMLDNNNAALAMSDYCSVSSYHPYLDKPREVDPNAVNAKSYVNGYGLFWSVKADDIAEDMIADNNADPSWAGHIYTCLKITSDYAQPEIVGDTSYAHAAVFELIW